MCIMHAPINRKTINVSNRRHEKKQRVPFNEELLKPDPDFKDERIIKTKVEKKGFFSRLLE